jgi:metal-dependent amidase/aminoacylase/carboxypeptidase family protein
MVLPLEMRFMQVEMLSQVPPLICDRALTEQLVGYVQELEIPGATPVQGISASASEDFASVAQQVPSTFLYLSAGFSDDRGAAPAHNPKVRFNEEVLPIGAACYAHCATRWLEDQK